MSNKPTISVVMPVYNGRKHLFEAIESVLTQTYSDFEFIIVNDGSTDDSESIILSFDDSRIKYIKQKNQGVGGALISGCNAAQGKYIARMDADDICIKDRFYVQKIFLDRNPSYVLVGSAVLFIDEKGNILSRSFPYTSNYILHKLVINNSPITHPSVMMRKDALNLVGGYQDLEPLEDVYLWLKLSKIGKLENLKRPLLKNRIVPDSVSRKLTLSNNNELRNFLFALNTSGNLSNEDILKFKSLYHTIKIDTKKYLPEHSNQLSLIENKICNIFEKLNLSEGISEFIICNSKKIYACLTY
jgi:glycosyltransferase involved in cell wall biosynthesis